jgi:hypothetical protein
VVKEQAVEVFTTDARVFDLTSELRTRKKIELPPVRVDASGRILVGTAEKGVTCTKCIVQFNPVINVGVNVNDSKLESFAVEFDGLMTANLEVSAVSPENAKVDTEAKLFEQSFHFLQNVGPVPIWEDVTVTVLARAQGQTDGKTAIRIGLGEEKRIRGLLAFEGASWDAFQEGPAKFVQENPTLSVERQGLAKLTLVPRVDVKLYGISGAAIEVGAAVQLDARACNKPPLWKTTSGLNVAVSGDLRAFQAEGRFEKELFREEKDLAAGDLPAGTTCPP